MAKQPIDMDRKQAMKDVFGKKGYKLDFRFVINDGKIHPLAILVPGGGYTLVCSFMEGTPIARKLNEKGISAVIVYYRTGKQAKCPNPIDDLARAIKEIFSKTEEYHLDIRNYSIWGASAGGHLTAEFGSDNLGYQKYGLKKPGALILAYPVITMDKEYTHMGSHDNFVGKNATKEEEDMCSVEKHVGKDYPSTFVWCGSADELVPNYNSIELDKALSEQGIDHIFRIYEGVAHGVGPGSDTAAKGWIDEAVEFWLKK